MENIDKYIKAQGHRHKIWEEMKPFEDKLHSLGKIIEEAEENLSWDEKKFIAQKLWENFSEKQQEDVLKVREENEKMFSENYTYCLTETPFDPFYDTWRLVDFKTLEDGKIQLEVSCKKREGTISGLMTFLDAYWTVPFDLNEIEG